MNDQTRRQLARIIARHRTRRAAYLMPDEVVELMEDCDALIRMLAREFGRKNEKREGTQ